MWNGIECPGSTMGTVIKEIREIRGRGDGEEIHQIYWQRLI